MEIPNEWIDETVVKDIIEKESNIWAKGLVMDNPIVTLIPEELRDDWDPDEPLPKPDIDLHLEWVYGYQGHTGGQFNNASNILFLQNVSILNCELFIFFRIFKKQMLGCNHHKLLF